MSGDELTRTQVKAIRDALFPGLNTSCDFPSECSRLASRGMIRSYNSWMKPTKLRDVLMSS